MNEENQRSKNKCPNTVVKSNGTAEGTEIFVDGAKMNTVIEFSIEPAHVGGIVVANIRVAVRLGE
jgi:hypothetical protein